MHCKEIEEKLIDYIDGILDEEEARAVNEHIENCGDCKKNLDGLKETINDIGEANKNIEAPHDFIETIKKEVAIKRSLVRQPRRKTAYIVLVSILITLLITGVFANESLQAYIEIWKGRSLKESHSIEQLIAEGYGEKMNIVSVDKNIKVTLESVIADDINTVFLIEVEDLSGENKYAPILWENTIAANGKFNYYLPGSSNALMIDKASIEGSFLLHTPEKNKTRTVLAFSPIASEHDEVELIISALQVIAEDDTSTPHAFGGQYYYDKRFDDITEGSWRFKVQVKPSESHVFDINEEMILDGHRILFNQLKVSPTKTTLTYKFNGKQNNAYVLNGINNIMLEADGILYEMKSYGRGSMRTNNYGSVESTLSFDTMYFQMPNRIKITVEGYTINVNEQSIFEIDIKRPFPQEFQYLDSKLSVTNVQGDENMIRISMDNLGEKYFERLLFNVFINNREYMEAQYAGRPLHPEDVKNRQVSGYDILLNNTTKTLDDFPDKGYEINEGYIKYINYDGTEKAAEELMLKGTLDDKIKSIQIRIGGYEEQRIAKGSLTFKLVK